MRFFNGIMYPFQAKPIRDQYLSAGRFPRLRVRPGVTDLNKHGVTPALRRSRARYVVVASLALNRRQRTSRNTKGGPIGPPFA